MNKLLKIPIVTLLTCLLFCYLGNTELSAQNAKQQCEDVVDEATTSPTASRYKRANSNQKKVVWIDGRKVGVSSIEEKILSAEKKLISLLKYPAAGLAGENKYKTILSNLVGSNSERYHQIVAEFEGQKKLRFKKTDDVK